MVTDTSVVAQQADAPPKPVKPVKPAQDAYQFAAVLRARSVALGPINRSLDDAHVALKLAGEQHETVLAYIERDMFRSAATMSRVATGRPSTGGRVLVSVPDSDQVLTVDQKRHEALCGLLARALAKPAEEDAHWTEVREQQLGEIRALERQLATAAADLPPLGGAR